MDREGLPFNAERNMSYNSRLAQELEKWSETKGKAEEVANALFRAYFVDVKNIGKADVLAKIAEENDLPADEATDVLLRRKYKDAVDECLCFGWIDGVRYTVDKQRWRERFTPRRAIRE